MRKITGFTGLTLLAIALALGAGTEAGAQEAAPEMSAMKAVAANTLAWSVPEVPGFDPGMRMAVVSGDPGAAAPYVLRLSFPAGYKFPAHWHPRPENLTVLSGTLELGMGDTRDDTKLKRYTAGDFLWIDARHPHFGGAVGETVVQLHGTGPFTIEVVGLAKK